MFERGFFVSKIQNILLSKTNTDLLKITKNIFKTQGKIKRLQRPLAFVI